VQQPEPWRSWRSKTSDSGRDDEDLGDVDRVVVDRRGREQRRDRVVVDCRVNATAAARGGSGDREVLVL
jgi:hypothetical protein